MNTAQAKDAGLFTTNDAARIRALRSVIGVALLAGICFSFNLWFPVSRSFPRAPLIFALPQTILPTIEYLLSGLLVIALAALVFAKRPARYMVVATTTLVLLSLLDQMRWQPWVYQYLLLFVVITLHHGPGHDEQSTRLSLSLLQLIVAALYFWSGLHKLNYSFFHAVLPQLLAPLQNYLALSQRQLTMIGIGIALIEIFIGCGLLLKRTRPLCVWLGIAMHAVILVLLIGQGRNSVVWTWNIALMLALIILFRQSDTFLWQTLTNRQSRNSFGRAAQILILACCLLPVLSFWGWWDLYLSGALYSGKSAVAVVRVDESVDEKLPETARRQVFATPGNERMLPVFEWAMSDLNVPPYPALRVHRQVAREICGLAENKNQVELIIQSSPAILDGSSQIIRMSCSQLEE